MHASGSAGLITRRCLGLVTSY